MQTKFSLRYGTRLAGSLAKHTLVGGKWVPTPSESTAAAGALTSDLKKPMDNATRSSMNATGSLRSLVAALPTATAEATDRLSERAVKDLKQAASDLVGVGSDQFAARVDAKVDDGKLSADGKVAQGKWQKAHDGLNKKAGVLSDRGPNAKVAQSLAMVTDAWKAAREHKDALAMFLSQAKKDGALKS